MKIYLITTAIIILISTNNIKADDSACVTYSNEITKLKLYNKCKWQMTGKLFKPYIINAETTDVGMLSNSIPKLLSAHSPEAARKFNHFRLQYFLGLAIIIGAAFVTDIPQYETIKVHDDHGNTYDMRSRISDPDPTRTTVSLVMIPLGAIVSFSGWVHFRKAFEIYDRDLKKELQITE
jgi:hypothetical protein